jgi:hypothetical protein
MSTRPHPQEEEVGEEGDASRAIPQATVVTTPAVK